MKPFHWKSISKEEMFPLPNLSKTLPSPAFFDGPEQQGLCGCGVLIMVDESTQFSFHWNGVVDLIVKRRPWLSQDYYTFVSSLIYNMFRSMGIRKLWLIAPLVRSISVHLTWMAGWAGLDTTGIPWMAALFITFAETKIIWLILCLKQGYRRLLVLVFCRSFVKELAIIYRSSICRTSSFLCSYS